MKKKYRDIIVNGIEYAWVVNNYNCDGDGGSNFKVWKDKEVIYEKLIHNEIITPKIVKEIINGL